MNQKVLQVFLALFLLNKLFQQYGQVPHWFASYADDLMVMPILLGSALWVQQKMVFRDFSFKTYQIWSTFLVISFVFEVMFPQFILSYTADIWDVFMYASGTLFFQIFQNPQQLKSKE